WGRLFRERSERHLVRAPIVRDRNAVDFTRARPSLRCLQYEHGPTRPLAKAVRTRIALDLANTRDDAIERLRHAEMRLCVRRFLVDVVRLIPVAAQELTQLLAWNARKGRWARHLEPIQIRDRQHGSVAHRA